MPREKCEHSTKEDPKMLRNKTKIMEQMTIVEASQEVNYSQTKGIKRFCALNELKYFHFTENISVDILHDLNEGTIPFLMKELFNRCVSLKLFSLNTLNRMIQFYDFGSLNSKNKPSQLKIKRKNLGQNGAQSRCLFLHLPFILSKYRSNYDLAEIWICVKSLQKICQIVYSHKITDSDLVALENAVRIHLESVQKYFKVKLTPKHHFLTHYGTVIRSMGPVIHMSMIRFESKHKYFKDLLKKSNNFMNINKWLAKKHQQFMSTRENGYQNEIKSSSKKILNNEFITEHADILSNQIGIETDLHEVEWLRCNGIVFKSSFLIFSESMIFEIIKILCKEDKYYFFCNKFDKLRLDKYCNCLEIQKSSPTDCRLILFDSLAHKKSYERKIFDEKQFIIADTLEVAI